MQWPTRQLLFAQSLRNPRKKCGWCCGDRQLVLRWSNAFDSDGKEINSAQLVGYHMAQLLFNNKPATPLSGTWKADFETQLGLQKYTFVFKVDGESLTASGSSDLDGQVRQIEFKEVELKDNTLAMVEAIEAQGRELRIAYTGTISGDEIKFQRAVGNLGSSNAIAKREQSANGAPP